MGVVYFSIIPTFEPSRYCKCWIVCFYNSYLQINVSSSTVVFDDALISEMKKENENQILIYEVQNCM